MFKYIRSHDNDLYIATSSEIIHYVNRDLKTQNFKYIFMKS